MCVPACIWLANRSGALRLLCAYVNCSSHSKKRSRRKCGGGDDQFHLALLGRPASGSGYSFFLLLLLLLLVFIATSNEARNAARKNESGPRDAAEVCNLLQVACERGRKKGSDANERMRHLMPGGCRRLRVSGARGGKAHSSARRTKLLVAN